MPSSRKKSGTHTTIKIVLGFFLLAPLLVSFLQNLAPSLRSSGLLALIFLAAIAPWIPFYNANHGWIVYPYMLATAFYLMHVVFARDRFPRWSKALHAVRPFFLLLMAAYFASGLSRVSVIPLPSPPGIEAGETQAYVGLSGFPFRFSTDVLPRALSLGKSAFDPARMLANVTFYFFLFGLIRYAWKKTRRVIIPINPQ